MFKVKNTCFSWLPVLLIENPQVDLLLRAEKVPKDAGRGP
jgi:hypothetical protein